MGLANFLSIERYEPAVGIRLRHAGAILGHGKLHILWNLFSCAMLLAIAMSNPLMPSDVSRNVIYVVLLIPAILLLLFLIIS